MFLVPSLQHATNVEIPVGGAPPHLGGSLPTSTTVTGRRPPEPVVGRAMVGQGFWAPAGKGSKMRFTCGSSSAGGRKVFTVSPSVDMSRRTLNKLAMRGMGINNATRL